MDYFLFLTRHTVNCRRQTEIKAKSTVQIPFFEKSAEMQLLNSNIPQRARTTRYSNKKAQDLLNLMLFVFCSFFVLQRWWAGVDSDHRSQVTTDLQSVPFGRSGTCPYYGAGDWNRTHNLLITNQLLCQLSYTSEKIKKNGALGRNRTTDRGIFSPLLYRLSYQGIYVLPLTHG